MKKRRSILNRPSQSGCSSNSIPGNLHQQYTQSAKHALCNSCRRSYHLCISSRLNYILLKQIYIGDTHTYLGQITYSLYTSSLHLISVVFLCFLCVIDVASIFTIFIMHNPKYSGAKRNSVIRTHSLYFFLLCGVVKSSKRIRRKLCSD